MEAGKGLVLLNVGMAKEFQIHVCEDCGTTVGSFAIPPSPGVREVSIPERVTL